MMFVIWKIRMIHVRYLEYYSNVDKLYIASDSLKS